MQQNYFDGLSQMYSKNNRDVVFWCIGNNSYYYLSLLLKHFDKNKNAIQVNYFYVSKQHPLLELLSNDKITDKEKFLRLYLSLCDKTGEKIKDVTMEQVMQKCDNNDMFAKMIAPYMAK